MSFYYTREAGPEGQIITGEGEAPGVDLSALLEAGPLPIRVALELSASVADIITVAEDDRAVHGDLNAMNLRVDQGGAVSIEGYGMPRQGGRAPEGRPVGPATDVYGLGTILLSALTGTSFGAVARDRDGHDEAIVQKLLTIDWQHLANKRWLEDFQRFLCTIFAFSPEERPNALDVANVLNQVGGLVGGDDLMTWAARAVRAAGGTQGKLSMGTITPIEDLGGPQTLGAPVTSTSAFRIRQAASAKGESTAIWSREKIAAMLNEEDDEDAAKPLRQTWKPEPAPKVGRPTDTGAHTQDPPRLMPLPPTPQPPPPPPPPDPTPAWNVADRSSGRGESGPPTPVVQGGNGGSPFANQGGNGGSPFANQGNSGSPFASQGNGGYSQPDSYEDEPEPTPTASPMKWVLIGLGVVFLVLACAGGGGLWYYFSQQDQTTVETTTPPVEEPQAPTAAEQDTGKAAAEPTPEPVPTPEPTPEPEPVAPPPTTSARTTSSSSSSSSSSSGSSTRSSGSSSRGSTSTRSSGSSSSSSGSSSSGSTSSRGSTSTRSSTPTTATGPFLVKFVMREGEATIQCGDGQQSTFTGSTRMSFEGITTCRVKAGPALGAFQVTKSATFTCTSDGAGRVNCTET